jgi:hypothetical protein
VENRNTLLIRGDSTSGFLITLPDEDRQPSETAKIVFRKYGNRYFFGEVWMEGEITHTHTAISKAEKRMTSELAGNKIAPTSVEVAALETSR